MLTVSLPRRMWRSRNAIPKTLTAEITSVYNKRCDSFNLTVCFSVLLKIYYHVLTSQNNIPRVKTSTNIGFKNGNGNRSNITTHNYWFELLLLKKIIKFGLQYFMIDIGSTFISLTLSCKWGGAVWVCQR